MYCLRIEMRTVTSLRRKSSLVDKSKLTNRRSFIVARRLVFAFLPTSECRFIYFIFFVPPDIATIFFKTKQKKGLLLKGSLAEKK